MTSIDICLTRKWAPIFLYFVLNKNEKIFCIIPEIMSSFSWQMIKQHLKKEEENYSY